MAVLITAIFLLLIVGFYFFMGLLWWKIVKKTGFNPAWGLLLLLPVLNIFGMVFLAFREWPVRAQLTKHSDSGITVQKSLAMPVIVVIAIATMVPALLMLIAIALPNFVRSQLIANETGAQSAVMVISQSLEDYAKANNGVYPDNESALKYPAGAEAAYDDKTIDGYTYSLNFRPDGYEVIANPERCGATGLTVFLAETGGKTAVKDCE